MIGKRYQEEKKEEGYNQHSVNRVPHSEEAKSTGRKIAEQHQVSHATVERAEKFANAVDKVAENVGVNPQKILSGEINASRRDIQKVSKCEQL